MAKKVSIDLADPKAVLESLFPNCVEAMDPGLKWANEYRVPTDMITSDSDEEIKKHLEGLGFKVSFGIDGSWYADHPNHSDYFICFSTSDTMAPEDFDNESQRDDWVAGYGCTKDDKIAGETFGVSAEIAQ